MKAVRETDNWWPKNCPIEELTNSHRVGECGRMLTDRERMQTVDSNAIQQLKVIKPGGLKDYYCLTTKTSH